jgi:predicted transcriptional regulator
MAEYNTGKVNITSQERKVLIKILEIDNSALSKSIKRLLGKGLITGSGGTYYINPVIFWKGDTKTRAELLSAKKLSININFEKE